MSLEFKLTDSLCWDTNIEENNNKKIFFWKAEVNLSCFQSKKWRLHYSTQSQTIKLALTELEENVLYQKGK